MNNVYDKIDELINEFNNTDFVNNMKKNKEIIIKNNLLDNVSYTNPIIKDYISNTNTFDLYIYYMNTELSKLIKR